MLKRSFALLAVLCIMLCSPALADVWEGVTMVHSTTAINAPSSGILEQLEVCVGQVVTAGQTLGSIRANRVYATGEGVVARIAAEPGEEVSGTVVEVSQISPYVVYCTVDRSYITKANREIHNGQTLYLRCTSNGTHRAIGFAYNVSNTEFTMDITAGEMYIGETMYVYSDPACDQKSRVAIGTVVGSSPDTYTTNGTVLQVRVTEGQVIERGKLLYTWADGDSLSVTSPADGIITAISVSKGSSAKKDAAVAEMAAFADIQLEIHVTREQLNRLHMDDTVTYTTAADQGDVLHTGKVAYIAALPEEDLYTVRITPDVQETLLGMSVEVSN